MKYYKLLYDYEKDEDAVFLEIDESSLPIDRYDVEKGVKIEHWSGSIKVSLGPSSGQRMTDYIANDLTWFIVSEKLKKILENTYQDMLQLLPLKVSCDYCSIEQTVYLANPFDVVDALDLDHSKYSVYALDENETMISIQKYALKSSAVFGHDIFRIKNDGLSIFISDKLRKELLKNKVSGCDYLEVKVV